MNANGARTESNNFMVDSSTISSSQRSGVVNVTPNPEVVEEVRVAVNNFSAAYGTQRLGGGEHRHQERQQRPGTAAAARSTQRSLQAKNKFQKRMPGFKNPDFGRKETAWGFGGPVARRTGRSSSRPATCFGREVAMNRNAQHRDAAIHSTS